MTAKKDNRDGEIIPAPKKHGGGPKEHYPFGKELEKLLENVRTLSAAGNTKANISAYIGINFKTFNSWMDKHEELAEAFKSGREYGVSIVKGLVFEKAIGERIIDPKTGRYVKYANGQVARSKPSMSAETYFLSKFAKDLQPSKTTLELAQAKQIELQNELLKSQAELAKAKAELAKIEVENAKRSAANTDEQINIVDRWQDDEG